MIKSGVAICVPIYIRYYAEVMFMYTSIHAATQTSYFPDGNDLFFIRL